MWWCVSMRFMTGLPIYVRATSVSQATSVLQRVSLLLARLGPLAMSAQCPLSRVDRTFIGLRWMAAIDPCETSAALELPPCSLTRCPIAPAGNPCCNSIVERLEYHIIGNAFFSVVAFATHSDKSSDCSIKIAQQESRMILPSAKI